MFPLILGVLAILGLAVRDPATEIKIQTLIVQSFPANDQQQHDLLSALHSVKQSAGWFGIVSIAGLMWSASGIFGSMEFVFDEIFGIKQRDFVRQKLMGFVMMLVLVVAIGFTFAANSLAGFLPSVVSWATSFAIGAVVMIVLLVLLYRFVPNRAFRLTEVLPGALLAGVLIEVLSLAWPLYANVSHGFNTYGKGFALFFLLAAWFYLLSNLILLGAVYNKFRLGEPEDLGLIASPPHKTRDVPSPKQAIQYEKRKKEVSAPRRETEGEGPPTRRSVSTSNRLAGYVLVGLMAFIGLFRRRGSHSIET